MISHLAVQGWIHPGPESPGSGPDAGAYWSRTGSMSAKRYGHTATLLPDGRVLVAGGRGYNAGDISCYDGGAPMNDHCSGAIALAENVYFLETTRGATDEGISTCFPADQAQLTKGVWF